MTRLLAWIKANPITVGSAVAATAAMVFLMIVNSSGHGFVERMSQRTDEINRIKNLQNVNVTIPPARPDQPERHLQVAVNQAAIDQLDRVYRRMNREYTEIFGEALRRNQTGHEPMLRGLFPKPADHSMPFEAKLLYPGLFQEMLGRPADSSQPDSALNAGPPPSSKLIEARLEKVERDYLSNVVFPPKDSPDQLTALELTELERLMSKELVDALQEHAQSIHLYADVDIDSSDFPFDVGQWSKPGPRPQMKDVWEGQLGLWIQQDIAKAIAVTNRVEDPQSNVMIAPVKHLIKIELVPGYVGLGSARGGLHDANRPEGAFFNEIQETAPPADQQDQTQNVSDFSVSPSGRRSNPMYDVRHVKVSLVVDSQMMPLLFKNIQQVNFMTILKMSVSDVDEYEALRQGYVYGAGDSVRLDMLLETIWLRDWTMKYMPESVRLSLGVTDQRDPVN